MCLSLRSYCSHSCLSPRAAKRTSPTCALQPILSIMLPLYTVCAGAQLCPANLFLLATLLVLALNAVSPLVGASLSELLSFVQYVEIRVLSQCVYVCSPIPPVSFDATRSEILAPQCLWKLHNFVWLHNRHICTISPDSMQCECPGFILYNTRSLGNPEAMPTFRRVSPLLQTLRYGPRTGLAPTTHTRASSACIPGGRVHHARLSISRTLHYIESSIL